MEVLQRLTRRQLEALALVASGETADRGVPLNAVARGLKVSAPSALEHVGALETLGLVLRYRGKTRLTPRGRGVLDEYLRHHRIAEAMFGRLGLSPEASCRAAREVDLAVSHSTVERVCEAEGHPSTCPHGEPIPPCRVAQSRSG